MLAARCDQAKLCAGCLEAFCLSVLYIYIYAPARPADRLNYLPVGGIIAIRGGEDKIQAAAIFARDSVAAAFVAASFTRFCAHGRRCRDKYWAEPSHTVKVKRHECRY